MKDIKYILLYVVGWLGVTVMAAVPINFEKAQNMKQVNRSVEYPIFVWFSSDPAYSDDNFFSERVIARLGHDGLPLFKQKFIRNEICASFRLQTNNPGLSFDDVPAAMGIYEHNGNIVAIHGKGFAGEKLTSVLMKFKYSDLTSKVNIAASFAAEMRRLIVLIHASDIIWNNANLSNFYVQPNGSLMAYDMSAAKNDPGGMDTPLKIKERNEFVDHVLRRMYDILFPSKESGQANADNAYGQFKSLAGIGDNWQNTPMTQANFNMIAQASAVSSVYRPASIDPFTDLSTTLLRNEHGPAAGTPGSATIAANMGGNTGFVLDAAVMPFFTAPVGNPPVVPTNLITLCNNW